MAATLLAEMPGRRARGHGPLLPSAGHSAKSIASPAKTTAPIQWL